MYKDIFGQLIQRNLSLLNQRSLLRPNIDWTHQYQMEKYEDLQEQCVKNGRSTDIFPLEIGGRGCISNLTSTFLTKLGLSPAERRKYIKKDPKHDCNCIWADMTFLQIKHNPKKSGSIVRYLGEPGLVVMMLRPRNHAWTQGHHLI